ncbi:MAG: oligosaccharide flippase family protein [Candidatus Aenigmatarchaeota archaeon]
MKPQKKALENVFFISLSWIISTLGGFIFWLIAGKFLDQEDYGIALTITSLGFFIISLITLGLPSALTKLISEYKGKRKYERIKYITTVSLIIILFSNIIFISIFIIFKKTLILLLKVSEITVHLLLIYVVIGSFSTTLYSIVYSLQEMKKYFIIGLASVASKLSISLFILFMGLKYFGPIIGIIASNIITLILCLPTLKVKKIKSIFDEDLYKYAFTAFVGTLSISMLSNFQYTIITTLKGNINTGIFGVAMMISTVIGAIPHILNVSIYPIISEIFHTRFKKAIPILLENTIKYSLLIVIPLIIVFSILSNFLVLSFSSYKFLDAAKLVPLLSVSTLFFTLSNIFMNTLFAIRKPKIYVKIFVTIMLVFLIITLPLTHLYSEIGMAIGYLLTTIFYLLLSYNQLKKFIKFSINIRKILSIFIASTSFIILYLVKPQNLTLVLLYTTLNFIIYFSILVFLNFFTKDEIDAIKHLLQRFNQK